MSTTTDDVIRAATSVARDVAEGRLKPDDLERQAVAELSGLMLIDPEPGSDLAQLQAESARRVLARGDLPAAEVAEWAAVARRRAGEPVTEPTPDIDPPTPISCVSDTHSPEPVAPGGVPAPEAVEPAPPVAKDAPPRRSEGGSSTYNPLTGWSPGQTRRH